MSHLNSIFCRSMGKRSYSLLWKPASPSSSSPWSDSRRSSVQVYCTYCVSHSTYCICFSVFLWLGCVSLLCLHVLLDSKPNESLLSVVSLNLLFFSSYNRHEELLHGLSLVRLIRSHSAKERLFCGVLVINRLYVVRSVFQVVVFYS